MIIHMSVLGCKLTYSPWVLCGQYVFKTEPYTANGTRTVHEELAKAMTAILKPSTDFLTSNKLLKVKDASHLSAHGCT